MIGPVGVATRGASQHSRGPERTVPYASRKKRGRKPELR